jgi:hypothetical protein
MNRSRWHKHLPIAVFVVGGGIAIAQSQTGEAVFPYVGYLEENGFAVTGDRTVRVDLFATANAAEAPCRSQTFSPVDLHAGRFQVEVTVPRAGGVYDACLAGGELFAGIAVGAADAAAGDLVALTSGLGGDRVRIGTVPFAAASPKAVPLLVADSVQVNGDVLADGTVSANVLSANSAAINGALTANSAAINGALSANSAALSGAVSATSVTVTGSTTLGATNSTLTVNGTVAAFGADTDLAINTFLTAPTDGLVVAQVQALTTVFCTNLTIFGDAGATAATMERRGQTTVQPGCPERDTPTEFGSFTMPVRKGEVYKWNRLSGSGRGTFTAKFYPLGR